MYGELYWEPSLCHGILANRHMINSSQCPLRTSDCESIKHALFQYTQVQEVRRILGLDSLISEVCTTEREGGAILADLLLSQNSLQSGVGGVQHNDLPVTAVWYIWWESRRFTHEQILQDPTRS